ncbi:MAG: 30S ribosomal protein S9 [Candidatus Kapabacteria bacterium]|jgi:small subunit ribosomal protein S9|nr:30S ribosomal protein S9 [Candidatus Kapabacteria bacterium]
MKVYLGTGRRKTSVAQVRLVPGNGKIAINKREVNDYFPVDVQRVNAFKPMEITSQAGAFDISITVRGGGPSGQMGAIQLGLSRALLQFNEELRTTLRPAGMLTRDPRMVERKKYGLKKARKRFQFSKR